MLRLNLEIKCHGTALIGALRPSLAPGVVLKGWAHILVPTLLSARDRTTTARETVASVLQQTATNDIVVSSFDVYFLQILRQSMPDLRLASIHDEPVQMSKLLAEAPAIEAVHLKHSLIRSPDDVAVFHDKGLDLRAWTVNDADRAVQLFDWGVDMVISDDPEQISSAAF